MNRGDALSQIRELEHRRATDVAIQRMKLEQIVLALRRRLRLYDPDLPQEYDGAAWHKHEKNW